MICRTQTMKVEGVPRFEESHCGQKIKSGKGSGGTRGKSSFGGNEWFRNCELSKVCAR